jgi:Uma2 family endonuclease
MLVAEIEQPKLVRQPKVKEIPEALVYEIIDGRKLYYKGYKDVLSKKKKIEDIMGSSTLQGYIIFYVLKICYRFLDDKKYIFLTNETGIHLEKSNNLSSDISIFEKTILTPNEINVNYAQVAPKIVIEVDIKIHLFMEDDFVYINAKTQKLLEFGVEKVIWVLSKSKSILIATKDGDWLIRDWNKDVELLDNQSFNIGEYLKSEGVEV